MKRNREEWENESKVEDKNIDYASIAPYEKEDVKDERRKCPYLDTINRHLIDFDSEKLCSQTLTNRNVYVCLVCGKFFEGRGKNTPAYTHSLQLNHYVFMNVESGRAYCLPDGYEVIDAALHDIQRCLCPEYHLKDISSLDRNVSLARDVHGVSYLPGFLGLNNLTATDDVNVLLHMLSHITPFRDYFLQPELYSMTQSKLVKEFGLIVRKLWSPNNFKSTVSPQELVQLMSIESKRAFSIGLRSDVLDLFVWLLNHLQRAIEPKSKHPFENSALFDPFQGIVEVTTCTKKLVDSYEEQKLLEKLQKGESIANDVRMDEDGWVKAVQQVPFTYLSLDIPPCPLFRDSQGGLIIPQLPLFQLLSKFDGVKWNDQFTKEAHHRKQYRLKRLPRYLILHLHRFTKNNFSLEKNPTIVNFPVRNLEMKDYLYSDQQTSGIDQKLNSLPSIEIVSNMAEAELKTFIQDFGGPLHHQEMKSLLSSSSSTSSASLLEDLRLIALRAHERVELFASTKYDLVANICHESEGSATGIPVGDLGMSNVYGKKKVANPLVPVAPADLDSVVHRGQFKIHLPCKATGQWYELQDLRVSETTPQLIGVSEAYILIYEKKSK